MGLRHSELRKGGNHDDGDEASFGWPFCCSVELTLLASGVVLVESDPIAICNYGAGLLASANKYKGENAALFLRIAAVGLSIENMIAASSFGEASYKKYALLSQVAIGSNDLEPQTGMQVLETPNHARK